MNVQIFSDNVPVELEVKLKHLGRSLGLLVMGPGCGTSIIGSVPIGFANVVAPGPIGIVGASGTGIQEVTVLVDRLNSGISHAIGLGGRDLSDAVGGTSAQMALEALASDAGTKVVVLVSKPPGPRTAERIIQAVNDYPKPVVLAFLGAEPAMLAGARHVASNLEEAAAMAVSLTDGFHATKAFRHWAGESKDVLAGATGQIPPLPRRYLRGLFTGGTLAEEATLILEQYLGRVFSNVRSDPAARLADPGKSVAHTVLDLGDDAFTQGRPHPMIDPSYRTERLLAEWADPEVAVLLCDVVLGHGCHDHPAAGLAAAVRKARLRYGEVTVIAHVCGTERDPQVLSIQRDILEAAGILVFPTNASAASAAGRLTQLCYERKST
jgi:FdrA protein